MPVGAVALISSSPNVERLRTIAAEIHFVLAMTQLSALQQRQILLLHSFTNYFYSDRSEVSIISW